MPDGILNIDKPSGLTSFQVVSRVRRLSGMRKVGHAGTLDPMATGVLAVCLGKATRVVEYAMAQPKTYRGMIELGVTTDTYDSEGTVTSRTDPSAITEKDLSEELRRFTGTIDQTPPAYSALKRGGRPMYEYARAGEPIELKPRTVHAYRVELLRFDSPRVEIEVECGRGFYVRSLAHDLGARLGCGAHLLALIRTRSGPFILQSAVSLEALESASEAGCWEDHLLATDRALESLPAAILSEEHSTDVRHGRGLNLGGFTGASRIAGDRPICRAYSAVGDLLGLLKPESEGAWKVSRVFSAP